MTYSIDCPQEAKGMMSLHIRSSFQAYIPAIKPITQIHASSEGPCGAIQLFDHYSTHPRRH